MMCFSCPHFGPVHFQFDRLQHSLPVHNRILVQFLFEASCELLNLDLRQLDSLVFWMFEELLMLMVRVNRWQMRNLNLNCWVTEEKVIVFVALSFELSENFAF